MTDKETIKALECCKKPVGAGACKDCPLDKGRPCTTTMIENALDLINRQQAEIERLEKIRKADNNLITSLNKCYETAKAEAIKKFIGCATDLCYKEFENDLEVAHTFASILTEAQKEMLGEE